MRIVWLRDIGYEFEQTDFEKCKAYYLQAIAVSKKLKLPNQEAGSINDLGSLYEQHEQCDTAVIVLKEALELAKKINAFQIAGAALGNLGNCCLRRNQRIDGVNYYIEAASYFAKAKDTSNTALVYSAINVVFNGMHNYQKAYEYGEKSIEYALKTKKTSILARAYVNASSNLVQLNQTEKAFNYMIKALEYARRSAETDALQDAYYNIAEHYLLTKNYPVAQLYADSNLVCAKQIDNNEDLSASYNLEGEICVSTNKPDVAMKSFLKSVDYAEKNGGWKQLSETYLNLAQLEKQIGNYKQAYEYISKYSAVKDSLLNQDTRDRLSELEAKYQSAQKQDEIKQLQKEQQIQQLSIRQKSTLNYALLGGLIALLIIGSLFYRSYQRKQQLLQKNEQIQAQRIRELEQEQQLIATNALLKGQEEERSRVAKDLHDGLGGMLSGIKLTLYAMKGNVILSADNANLFSKTVEQLDNSISEMRRVAHNMMPEALVKFGLAQALQDYCEGINDSSQINCVLQLYGLEKRLDGTTEVVIYRIIQELLNNVIKHANATEAVVQVIRNGDKINITIEDNGKGFDMAESGINKGAGLSNVRSRVSYLHGTMDVESARGKGTSVHIDNLTDNSYE